MYKKLTPYFSCRNLKYAVLAGLSLFLILPLFSFHDESTRLVPQMEAQELSTITVFNDTINKPKKVKAEKDGTLRLKAAVGRGIGPGIKFMPEWRAFGWFAEKDRVEWKVKVPKNGDYDVFLEWSVSDKEAGKPFIFEAGDKNVYGTIGKSGSWETFKTVKIGRVTLSRGTHTMTFKADPKSEAGALLDLREVKLVPVN